MRALRTPYVIANWKMNGSSADAEAWAARFLSLRAAGDCRCAVCAPFVYLPQLVKAFEGTGVAVGAETVSAHDAGAFTGEVSADMLRDIGVTLCIIGHSERRSLWHETNDDVAAQAEALAKAGIPAVLCVGETLAEREAGRTIGTVTAQLEAVLSRVAPSALAAVAYEPVWAIGTGRTATPETAQEVHAALRAAVSRRDAGAAADLPLLYGGSVKPANAAALFAQPDIDGGLIGGASLQADSFHAICAAARAN